MKQYRILLFSILSSFMLFAACTDEEDPRYETGTYASSAEFTDPDSGKEYTLLEGTGNNTFEVYQWSASDYGIPVGMRYTLQLDSVGKDFTSAVNLVTTTDRQARITVNEMNNAIASLGVTDYEQATRFQIRIVTNAYGGEEGITPLPDYPAIYSQVIELLVTPYLVANEEPQKAAIYIVGTLVDGVPTWDNSKGAIGNGLQVFFSDDSNMDNKKYSYTGTFVGGSAYKIIQTSGDWGDAYAFGSSGVLIGDNGGDDIPGPASSGIYTLNVDLDNLTYSYTTYTGETKSYDRIGVIGSATPTGWDGDTEMKQVTPHVWVLELELVVGEVKFRADNGWDINWGGKEIPFGIGTQGGDNIVVENPGTYFLALNDLTNQYIIVKKDRMP